jgi:hypothetical protein
MALSEQRKAGLIAVAVVLAAGMFIVVLIGIKLLTNTWAEHSFNEQFPSPAPTTPR